MNGCSRLSDNHVGRDRFPAGDCQASGRWGRSLTAQGGQRFSRSGGRSCQPVQRRSRGVRRPPDVRCAFLARVDVEPGTQSAWTSATSTGVSVSLSHRMHIRTGRRAGAGHPVAPSRGGRTSAVSAASNGLSSPYGDRSSGMVGGGACTAGRARGASRTRGANNALAQRARAWIRPVM